MSSLAFLRYTGHAEFKQVQAGVKCSKRCARWACAELSEQSSASGVMMLNMTLSLAPLYYRAHQKFDLPSNMFPINRFGRYVFSI